MENIIQHMQNINSEMMHSIKYIEYGIFVSLVVIILSLFGISALKKGRTPVSTSAGFSSFLALLPIWFTSAEIGVAIFYIFFIVIFIIISKKKPKKTVENILHSSMIAGLISSMISLYQAYLIIMSENYFSQINFIPGSLFGLIPLFVFFLSLFFSNRKEHERLERDRLDARRAAREQARESEMEKNRNEENILDKQEETVARDENSLSFEQALSTLENDITINDEDIIIDDDSENITDVQNEIVKKHEEEILKVQNSEETAGELSDEIVESQKNKNEPEAPDELNVMELEVFCIQQEEHFKKQYDFIIKQVEILQKQKTFHQSKLEQSVEKLEFYKNQADLYMKQIDFYKSQRESDK